MTIAEMLLLAFCIILGVAALAGTVFLFCVGLLALFDFVSM